MRRVNSETMNRGRLAEAIVEVGRRPTPISARGVADRLILGLWRSERVELRVDCFTSYYVEDARAPQEAKTLVRVRTGLLV